MKISDILQSLRPQGKSSTSQPSGTDFQELLAEKISGNATHVHQADEPSRATETSPVSATLRLEAIDLTTSTLDTLEAYSAALADTRLDVELLEPYAASLEEHLAGLADLKEQLPGDDPLARLLDRVATVAYLETAKFRRGDYA